jgi:hypothetical protein
MKTVPFKKPGVILCVLTALLAVCGDVQAANSYSGGLSNGYYRFFRPATLNTTSGENVFFHAIYFTVQGSSPGNVTATVSGSGFTPRLHFYQNGTFDPYAALNNLWWMGTGTVTATNIAHGIEIQHLLIVSGTTAADVGSFTVTLTGPGPISVATNNDSALLIRTQPQNGSISAGQSSVVRAWASGRQPQKLQWYYGPKPASTNSPDPAKLIAGATNQSYFTPVLNQTTNYWCLVTGNNTTPANARSSLATVNVSQVPASFNGSLTSQHDTWNRMTSNNVSSGQICYFDVVPFRIFSAGSYTIALNTVGFPGSINLYSGKFFPSTPAVNFLENGVVDNAAGALNYTVSLQPGDYEMVISSASGGQVGTYSGEITGSSVPQMLPRPTLPVFLNLPKDRTVLTNTSVTLSFSVEGALPRTNQWFRGLPGDASQPIAGGTAKTYTTPLLANVATNYYWVRVANSYGATTSGPVRVRVVDGPITFGGKLRPGNKTFQRSNGAGGVVTNLSHYKTYVFEAPIVGTYNVSLSSTVVGIQASVYNQIFMTNNPNVNLHLLPAGNSFNLNVAAPTTFLLVIGTPNLAGFGTYSGTITGPGGALVNELPAPVFAPQPTPTNQFLWRNQDPAPIIGNANPVGSSWSWFRGVAPGVPVDFTTNIAGLNTRTNDQPASVAAEPTNLWFWARIDGSYGYDDSELCMLEVSPPPRFLTYPASRSIVYGNPTNLTTIVTNAPFLVRWFQAASPFQTNAVQSDVIQGFGPNYIRTVTKTNTTPLLNVGTYSYWLQSTNPSGVTNGPTITITVTKRPLFVSLSTPQGLTPYDGLPHPATVMAFDLSPGGPQLPDQLPIVLTYQLPGGPVVTNEPVNAGTYQVIATVNHSNYMGSATNSYTISKRALTARADDKLRQYGIPNPPLTISYANFAPGDSPANLDFPPAVTTLAAGSSPKGQYAITLSGGSDNNYMLNLVNGALTILGLPVVIAHTNDFTSNAPLNGTLLGSAIATNDVLYLTGTNSNENGQFFIASPGRPLRSLYVEFDLVIAGAPGTGGGFSFNYGIDATNATGNAEEGFGSGLSVLIDTFNDGGELVPRFGIKHGGAMLAQWVIPTFSNNTTNRVILDVSPAAVLALKLNGTTLTNVPLPSWESLPEWQFSFGARTAATLVGSHSIDNLLIGESVARLLLPTKCPPIGLALSPAFTGLSNIVYAFESNSNPALVTATVETHGAAAIIPSNDLVGSAVLVFRGTNSSVNALLSLALDMEEPEIISMALGADGAPQMQLFGPAKARFYLQETAALNYGVWRTVAAGVLDRDGFGIVSGLPSPATMRCYRVQFTAP